MGRFNGVADAHEERQRFTKATSELHRLGHRLDLDESQFTANFGRVLEIQPQSRLELEYTPEICRELGFIEIETVTQPMEFTRPFGEPLALFKRFSNPVEPPHTAIRIVALTVNAPAKGFHGYTWRRSEPGVRSCDSGDCFRQVGEVFTRTIGAGDQAVTVQAEPLSDAKGVKFTVRRQTNAEDTPRFPE